MRENHGYTVPVAAGWLTWMPYRTATPVNRSLGTWCHCPPNHRRQDTADMPETNPVA